MKAIRLYANVLVDVASSIDSKETVESLILELSRFASELAQNPILTKIFENPVFSEIEKQGILDEVLKEEKLNQLSLRFLSLLLKRGRLGMLSEILDEMQTIAIEKKGGLIGELVSAAPLDGETVQGISNAIGKRFKKTVQLKPKVDASLIAGMRVTLNGVTYDGSVQSKFAKLSESI